MSTVVSQSKLPHFVRVCWVSDGAREVWAPRLDKVRQAWAWIECMSVVRDVRPCALVWAQKGDLETLRARCVPYKVHIVEENEASCRIAVGPDDDVIELMKAWNSADYDRVGSLLGYPACCRSAYLGWTARGFDDPTWLIASGTADGTNRVCEVSGPSLCNVSWRVLGLRAVPHLPCSHSCPDSLRLAENILVAGVQSGYAEEVEYVRDLLTWPVEWSSLHGIAEIKTPLLRVSTRTDVVRVRQTVRWQGSAYPAEGAWGSRFPFRTPSRLPVTQSPGFQRGLKDPFRVLNSGVAGGKAETCCG